MDDDRKITKEEVYRFLDAIPLAVFGTVSADNTPHLVTMYYAVDADLNFYFITRSQTAKVANIERNPVISIVVSDKDTFKTVEAKGLAIPLSHYEKIQGVIRMFTQVYKKQGLIEKNKFFNWPPPLEKLKKGTIIVYQVQPTYLRYIDYSLTSPLAKDFVQVIIT